MKKFLALVLALVMTMSLVTISAGADFTDDSTINYDEAVDVMSAVGVVGGYADGSFNPAGTLTRGAAAKIICNMILGTTTADALAADAAPFADVPADHVFAGYIAYCVKEGIISGYADGTFRPAGTLTGYAFMKMLLGAIGYEADIEGYTGANWSIAVAKRALNIGLDKGLEGDFVGTKALTREEACLYAFNAMKAIEVNYGDKSTIKVGDIEISTSAEAKPVNGNAFYKNYFKKLVETTGQQYDAFGRPATEWKFNGKKVGTYASAADVSYTTKVSSATIYSDLGLAANDIATVTVDGESAANFSITKNDKTTKTGANGTVTEIFMMKDAQGNLTGIEMVQINTYIAQIDDVDTNADDERIVEIGTLDYVTEEFAEDDWVLYTVDLGETPDAIKSMVKVEKMTGELTKKVGSSKFTIDGTVYEASAQIVEGTYSVNKDVDFWVDEYGYIIKIDAADSSVDVANMALVKSAAAFRSAGWAKVVFSDGTAKEVDTDKNYAATTALDTNADGTGDAAATNEIVSYEVNEDGQYELSYVASTKDATATVVKGNPMVDAIKTNNATQFVYITTESDGTFSYDTYVGYKNAPSTTTNGAAVTAYVDPDTSVAALVFVEIAYTAVATTAADITVIAYDADVSATNEGTNKVYYEYNAVVDGEAATVKVLPSQWATLAGNDFYAVQSITYNKNNIGTLGSVYRTSSASTISVAGETITIGGTAYTYDDDTLVMLVDDGAIEVIDVEDIQKDEGSSGKNPYKTIAYDMDNTDAYVVDLIILVKNP